MSFFLGRRQKRSRVSQVDALERDSEFVNEWSRELLGAGDYEEVSRRAKFVIDLLDRDVSIDRIAELIRQGRANVPADTVLEDYVIKERG